MGKKQNCVRLREITKGWDMDPGLIFYKHLDDSPP